MAPKLDQVADHRRSEGDPSAAENAARQQRQVRQSDPGDPGFDRRPAPMRSDDPGQAQRHGGAARPWKPPGRR